MSFNMRHTGTHALNLHRLGVFGNRIQLQARRGIASEIKEEGKETLVVLGAGWAGYQFVRKVDKSRYKVVSISGSTTFVTTPLLPSAATGALSFRDIVEPLRSTQDVNYYHAWAEDVDFKNKVITAIPAAKPIYRGKDPLVKQQQRDARAEVEGGTESEYQIKYDKLVIATGCYNQTFDTPGVKENAYFLRDIESAAAIRWHIYEMLDSATWPDLSETTRQALLTWVIVGGGPTGSELAAEMHDLARSKEFNKLYPTLAPQIKIKLLDAAPAILTNFDKALSKYAAKKLQRDGIEVLTSRKVLRVEPNKIVTEQDGKIPTGLVVWSTGNKASPLNETLESLQRDKKQSFVVTEELQVMAKPTVEGQRGEVVPNVWAMGDCAQIEGHPLPATAQVANQEGVFLADLLSGRISDPAKKSFKYVHRGTMTNIGGGEGLVEAPFANVRGRLAYIAWRGYYWISSLSWRNKFNLAFRWTTNAIMGRDISRI